MAALRVILPTLPATIISAAALHRAHIPPHDTILALCLPPRSSQVQPYGKETALKALRDSSEIPGGLGKSSPQGQILLSFALPDTPPESRTPPGLTVTCANAVLKVEMIQVEGNRVWHLLLSPAKGSDVDKVEKKEEPSGVKVEIGMFSRAITAAKDGKGAGETEEDWGKPRDSLWDLAMIEACLTSDGEKVDLDKLLSGK